MKANKANLYLCGLVSLGRGRRGGESRGAAGGGARRWRHRWRAPRTARPARRRRPRKGATWRAVGGRGRIRHEPETNKNTSVRGAGRGVLPAPVPLSSFLQRTPSALPPSLSPLRAGAIFIHLRCSRCGSAGARGTSEEEAVGPPPPPSRRPRSAAPRVPVQGATGLAGHGSVSR